MDFITTYGVELLKIAGHVIAIAAIVAAATPNDFDNKAVAFLRKLIDFLGANFGHAKNESDKYKKQ